MAYNEFVQAILDAETDAQTLERVVNDPPDTQVKSRLGRYIWTIATIGSRVDSVTLQANRKLADLDDAINIAAAAGAGANGWTTQLVVSPVGITQQQINDRQKSLKDHGAAGDGVTDDLQKVQAAIDSGMPVRMDKSEFYVSSIPYNPKGVPYIGDGIIKMRAPNGGEVQLNTYADNTGKDVICREYMYRFLQRVAEGGMLRGHLFGDSTVATAANGGGFAGSKFEPQNILKKLFKAKGIQNPIDIQNHAIGGTAIYQMDAIPHIDTVNYTTDFFVIKYGINDAARGVDQFAIDLRNKLQEIRTSSNQGRVTDLTIFLVMPNATHAPSMGHHNIWYEKLRNIYMQAARDYKCVLFDTYAHFRDVTWAPGTAMDDLGNHEGIHPTGILQNHIWSSFVDYVINETAAAMYLPDPESMTLLNGWKAYDDGLGYTSGFAPVEADKDKHGYVSLRGVVKGGTTTAGTVIAQMPWFVKPQYSEQFVCNTASGFVTIRVLPNGTLQIADLGGDATYMSLSGIRFKSN